MTASNAYDPKRATGYRFEQLASAFDRVRDPRDWKAPIRAVIPVVERPVVEKAVLWFTETEPRFEAIPGETDRLIVVAAGYRLGPAGGPSDHMHSTDNGSTS
jgi:hypothetical protein